MTSAAGLGVNSSGISEAIGSGAGDNRGNSLVGHARKEKPIVKVQKNGLVLVDRTAGKKNLDP